MMYVPEFGDWRDERGDLIPMPETASPGFEQYIDWVKAKRRKNTLVFYVKEEPTYLETREFVAGDEVKVRTDHLHKRTFYAPAPFIGDPQWEIGMYYWDAFMGKNDSFVSLDAELRMRPYG